MYYYMVTKIVRKKVSEETRKKMSIAQRKRYRSPN